MKKLFAIFVVAGLLTACSNNEQAAKEAAEKATADSLQAVKTADSLKAIEAAANPVTNVGDTLKSKVEGAITTVADTLKGAANKVMDKVKEEGKK